MAVSAPDWLTKHGGSLRLGSDGLTWVVHFAGDPQYLVRTVPVAGKHGVEVEQFINCKRFEDAGKNYPSTDDALRGGLDDLRKKLGW